MKKDIKEEKNHIEEVEQSKKTKKPSILDFFFKKKPKKKTKENSKEKLKKSLKKEDLKPSKEEKKAKKKKPVKSKKVFEAPGFKKTDEFLSKNNSKNPSPKNETKVDYSAFLKVIPLAALIKDNNNEFKKRGAKMPTSKNSKPLTVKI